MLNRRPRAEVLSVIDTSSRTQVGMSSAALMFTGPEPAIISRVV
jgi:hypothetical protein